MTSIPTRSNVKVSYEHEISRSKCTLKVSSNQNPSDFVQKEVITKIHTEDSQIPRNSSVRTKFHDNKESPIRKVNQRPISTINVNRVQPLLDYDNSQKLHHQLEINNRSGINVYAHNSRQKTSMSADKDNHVVKSDIKENSVSIDLDFISSLHDEPNTNMNYLSESLQNLRDQIINFQEHQEDEAHNVSNNFLELEIAMNQQSFDFGRSRRFKSRKNKGIQKQPQKVLLNNDANSQIQIQHAIQPSNQLSNQKFQLQKISNKNDNPYMQNTNLLIKNREISAQLSFHQFIRDLNLQVVRIFGYEPDWLYEVQGLNMTDLRRQQSLQNHESCSKQSEQLQDERVSKSQVQHESDLTTDSQVDQNTQTLENKTQISKFNKNCLHKNNLSNQREEATVIPNHLHGRFTTQSQQIDQNFHERFTFSHYSQNNMPNSSPKSKKTVEVSKFNPEIDKMKYNEQSEKEFFNQREPLGENSNQVLSLETVNNIQIKQNNRECICINCGFKNYNPCSFEQNKRDSSKLPSNQGDSQFENHYPLTNSQNLQNLKLQYSKNRHQQQFDILRCSIQQDNSVIRDQRNTIEMDSLISQLKNLRKKRRVLNNSNYSQKQKQKLPKNKDHYEATNI
eukprot:403341612